MIRRVWGGKAQNKEPSQSRDDDVKSRCWMDCGGTFYSLNNPPRNHPTEMLRVFLFHQHETRGGGRETAMWGRATENHWAAGGGSGLEGLLDRLVHDVDNAADEVLVSYETGYEALVCRGCGFIGGCGCWINGIGKDRIN